MTKDLRKLVRSGKFPELATILEAPVVDMTEIQPAIMRGVADSVMEAVSFLQVHLQEVLDNAETPERRALLLAASNRLIKDAPKFCNDIVKSEQDAASRKTARIKRRQRKK